MSIQTLSDLFLNAVRNKPRRDCFSYRDETGRYVDVSSEETLRRVQALRIGLQSLGVRPGDRVAILAENRLEWALSDLACHALGAITVPIYATLLEDTIEYILRDCEPVVLFVSTDEQAKKVTGLRAGLPFLKEVVSFDRLGRADVLDFARLIETGSNLIEAHADLPGEFSQVDRNSPCSIIYTSGTTGSPKGVVLSHWNFVSNVLAVQKRYHILPTDRALSFLPMSHVLERTAGYYSMLGSGVGIAFAERMDTVPVDILDVQPSILISVPRLYEKIHGKVANLSLAAGFPKRQIFFWARDVAIRHARTTTSGQKPGIGLALQHKLADALVYKKLRAKLGGNIRIMVSGGAPLSARINAFFYGAGLVICEGYGLTETSPVLTSNFEGHFRFGSVGLPFDQTEIRIADDGEILARGPQVMLGYYRNEEATAEVIDADGWFATGDIGHIDEDGFLFITDRKKDLIVTAGGKNIAPQPLENRFTGHKYVAQAVVIGDRRQYLTVLLVPDFENLGAWARRNGRPDDPASLVTDAEVRAKFEQIVAGINEDFPGFSQVKNFALLEREFTIDEGELTPTLKVKRFAIAKKFADVIAALYPEAEAVDPD